MSIKLDVSDEDLARLANKRTVVLEGSNGSTKVLRDKTWLEIVTPYILFLMMAWAVPMTKTVVENYYELSKGPRYTALDGQAMEHRIAVVENKVSGLPPTSLLSDVAELKSEVKKLNAVVTRLGVLLDNQERFTR